MGNERSLFESVTQQFDKAADLMRLDTKTGPVPGVGDLARFDRVFLPELAAGPALGAAFVSVVMLVTIRRRRAPRS